MNHRPKRKQPPLSALDQFNNLCKAMAEEELLKAGLFSSATDTAEARDEITRLPYSSLPDEKDRAPHQQQEHTPEKQPVRKSRARKN